MVSDKKDPPKDPFSDAPHYIVARMNYMRRQAKTLSDEGDPQKLLNYINSLIADVGALTVALHQTIQERDIARSQADTDALTGIESRRVIEKEVAEMGERRKRHKDYIPATIVLIDVNRFKYINTQYTHAAGDAALRHIAGILKADLRKGDRLGRLGGDEFAFIMYNTTPEKVECGLADLANKIATTPFVYDGKKIPLSISYGAHEMHEKDTLEDAIKATSAKVTIHKKTTEEERKERITDLMQSIVDSKTRAASWSERTNGNSSSPGMQR